MTREKVILPGAVLGVLGGGQLGRMFTLAARRMGYRVFVFAPQDDTPAGQIAYRELRAEYDDLEAVERFAREVEVITFEFENVPAAAAEVAARFVPVRPAGSILHTTQERLREKRALRQLGLPVAGFAAIESESDLASAASLVGMPAVLKTASWGYDGKGQRKIEKESELEPAWRALGKPRAVLESFVPFALELSVVGVRSPRGEIALYDPIANRHARHILDLSLCPAPVSAKTAAQAHQITRAALEGLGVVGVLCVEMFVLPNGALLVNELAPRPHNSGHLTIDAHECGQFEQQVRAVCGLPLGSTKRVAPAAAMANLLGDLWDNGEPHWAAALRDPGVRLHLYGKTSVQQGRKMGHLTVTDGDLGSAELRAVAARAALVQPSEENPWISN